MRMFSSYIITWKTNLTCPRLIACLLACIFPNWIAIGRDVVNYNA